MRSKRSSRRAWPRKSTRIVPVTFLRTRSVSCWWMTWRLKSPCQRKRSKTFIQCSTKSQRYSRISRKLKHRQWKRLNQWRRQSSSTCPLNRHQEWRRSSKWSLQCSEGKRLKISWTLPTRWRSQRSPLIDIIWSSRLPLGSKLSCQLFLVSRRPFESLFSQQSKESKNIRRQTASSLTHCSNLHTLSGLSFGSGWKGTSRLWTMNTIFWSRPPTFTKSKKFMIYSLTRSRSPAKATNSST